MVAPTNHTFAGVHQVSALAYEGRCRCGFRTLPAPSKEKAYEDIVDHFMATPEMIELLVAEGKVIHEPSAVERAAAARAGWATRLPRRGQHIPDEIPAVEGPRKLIPLAQDPGAERSVTEEEAESRARHPAGRRQVMQQWVIGAHPECDVVIDDPYVSARHCVVWREASGQLFVMDYGSTNGTWLIRQAPHGPAPIQINRPTAILTGDQLKVGRTVLPNFPPEGP